MQYKEKAMDDEGSGAVIIVTIGAALVLIGLFLPIFTVHYNPPGGSAIVYGHRMDAFTETITGWQFATTARWTDILFVLGILVLPVVTLVLSAVGLGAVQFLTKPAMALFQIVVAVGWLLLLGVALIENYLVMPTGGKKEILASFHQDPFSTGYQQTLQHLGLNNPPTPHFSASFGAGWFLLLAGILIGLVGLWRWVIGMAVLVVVLLVILRFADHSLFNSISGALLGADYD
jgi:hypothetical protein